MQVATKIGQIQSLLQGPTTRWDERKILDLLSDAPTEEINPILKGIDIPWMLEDVDDHFLGPKNSQGLLRLLCQERVSEIDIDNRARLISALQSGRTHSQEEAAIRDLICATSGAQLTELKLKLDQQESSNDLHQLVYTDIDEATYRREILTHIAEQAGPARETKLLSDIDDTFYCNWTDKRYPKATVYPGVRQYYQEMDAALPGQPDDLTFVTARPDDRIGWVKSSTKKSLRKRGLGDMVILTGSVPSLINHQAIADKKFQRMDELRHLYPEYQLVFTGDSGQGDSLCGERLHLAGWPSYKATLIHDVVDTPEAERQRYREQGVHFFDTYVGAALEAQGLGQMDLPAVRRVAEAACQDFRQTAFINEEQRQARRVELERDLAKLNQQLPPQEAVQLGSLPPLGSLKLPEPLDLPNSG